MPRWLAIVFTVLAILTQASMAHAADVHDFIKLLKTSDAREIFRGQNGITEIVKFAIDKLDADFYGAQCARCPVVVLQIERKLENSILDEDPRAVAIFNIAQPSVNYLYHDRLSVGDFEPEWFKKSTFARYNVQFLSMFLANAAEEMSVRDHQMLIRQLVMLGIPDLQAAILMTLKWTEEDGNFLLEISPWIKDLSTRNFLMFKAVPLFESSVGQQIASVLLGKGSFLAGTERDYVQGIIESVDWNDSLAVTVLVRLFRAPNSVKWVDLLQKALRRGNEANREAAESAWLQLRAQPQWQNNPYWRGHFFRHREWWGFWRTVLGKPLELIHIVGIDTCRPYLK